MTFRAYTWGRGYRIHLNNSYVVQNRLTHGTLEDVTLLRQLALDFLLLN